MQQSDTLALPIKKFSASYRTERFMTLFKIARHLITFWAGVPESTFSDRTDYRYLETVKSVYHNLRWKQVAGHSHKAQCHSFVPTSAEYTELYVLMNCASFSRNSVYSISNDKVLTILMTATLSSPVLAISFQGTSTTDNIQTHSK